MQSHRDKGRQAQGEVHHRLPNLVGEKTDIRRSFFTRTDEPSPRELMKDVSCRIERQTSRVIKQSCCLRQSESATLALRRESFIESDYSFCSHSGLETKKRFSLQPLSARLKQSTLFPVLATNPHVSSLLWRRTHSDRSKRRRKWTTSTGGKCA